MLEAHDLVYGYQRNEPVIAGVSLEVSPGERVALLAPSGYGKTTLCRLLSGYAEPWSGEVLVDGKPFPRRGPCPVQAIGQHPENVLDPRMRMRDSLAEAGPINKRLLDSLGIRSEWMQRYPHELSGGEMQRFCIARALSAGPSYLIADEISTMLDAITQAQIWRFLIEWSNCHGAGIVFVSHSPELTARIATRCIDLTYRGSARTIP